MSACEDVPMKKQCVKPVSSLTALIPCSSHAPSLLVAPIEASAPGFMSTGSNLTSSSVMQNLAFLAPSLPAWSGQRGHAESTVTPPPPHTHTQLPQDI